MNIKSRLAAAADLRTSEYWEGLTFLDPKYDGAIIGVAESCPGREAKVMYDKKRLAKISTDRWGPKLNPAVYVLDPVDRGKTITKRRIHNMALKWDGGIITADDLEKAFVGLAQVSPRRALAVYDRERVLKRLADTFEPVDEDDDVETMAIEWYEYNVIGSWVGPKTPVFMIYLEDMTLD